MSVATAFRTKGIEGNIIAGRPWELDRPDIHALIGSVNDSEAFGYAPGSLLFTGFMWGPGVFRIQFRIFDEGWPWPYERADFSPIAGLPGLVLGDPFDCEDAIIIPESPGTPSSAPGT